MPRINKKTRIKGVPVKVLKTIKSSDLKNAGIKVKAASDNRDGLYNISPYDDKFSIPFNSPAANDLFSGLDESKSPVDNFNNFFQELEPFKDENLFSSDGKSREDSFWAEDKQKEQFGDAVWNKSTITFKLNTVVPFVLCETSASGINETYRRLFYHENADPAEDQQALLQKASLGCHYMCYYDTKKQIWRGNTIQFPPSGAQDIDEVPDPTRILQNVREGDDIFGKLSSNELYQYGNFDYLDSFSFDSFRHARFVQTSLLNLYKKAETTNSSFPQNVENTIIQFPNFPSSVFTGTAKFLKDDFFSFLKIGFANSMQTGLTPKLTNQNLPLETNLSFTSGLPVTNFGFPFAIKFKSTRFNGEFTRTKSESTFNQQNYPHNPNVLNEIKIDKPFLLEKIVLKFSASFDIPSLKWSTDETDINGDSIMENMPYAINTFFVLNQTPRLQKEYNKTTTDLNSGGLGDAVGIFGAHKDTTHLVTYLQHITVATSSNEAPFYFSRYTEGKNFVKILDPGNEHARWSEEIVMSGTIKSCEKIFGGAVLPMLSGAFGTPGDWSEYVLGNEEGGRTGRDTACERNFFSSFSSFEKSNLGLSSTHTRLNNSREKNDPYLILPGDKLIFGWHLPVSNNLTAYSSSLIPDKLFGSDDSKPQIAIGPRLTLPPGETTVVFYGSQIKDGSEFHDTLNQNLTSVSISEVIN